MEGDVLALRGVAELPRVKNVCAVPSVFITNRSEMLMEGVPSHSVPAVSRLLSNTIFLPSGDKVANASPSVFSVRRLGFEPSGLIK